MSFPSCLVWCVRDLQRLGELQTELAGAADFCVTYLRCQLLLMKVGVCTALGRLQFGNVKKCFVFLNKGSLTSSLFLQALQEKLWNMAVPLCLKQNVMASAAVQQVSARTHTHTHTCINNNDKCIEYRTFHRNKIDKVLHKNKL